MKGEEGEGKESPKGRNKQRGRKEQRTGELKHKQTARVDGAKTEAEANAEDWVGCCGSGSRN